VGVLSSILGGNILFLGALQEDGELKSLIVYRECDEESSSDAGIGGRGAQRPVFCVYESKKKGWRAAGARARSAAKTPYSKMFFYGCSNNTYTYTFLFVLYKL